MNSAEYVAKLIAMLSHEINGNSTDKLQAAMSDLQEYLIER